MKNTINIVISEKPSMGRNIAKGLNCNNTINGGMKNNTSNIIITWGFGHLLELKMPDEIDEKYKNWKIENLPIFVDFSDKYVVKKKTTQGDPQNQMNNIISLFRNNRDKKICVFHAGDPDREGELITRLIMKEVKESLQRENIDINKSIEGEYRMWLKDFSKKTIEGEFNSKIALFQYDGLYNSALARLHSDWLVGMNLTPYYTLITGSNFFKGGTLNVGRVQSAILKVIIDKEMEILNFKEELSYKIIGTFNKNKIFNAEWFSEKKKDGKLINKKQAQYVLDVLNNTKEFTVIKTKKEEKKEVLNELYSLVDLQVDAEKKYGYSPTDTLNIYQKIYEKQIASYPRNDNGYLSDDDFQKAEKGLRGLINISPFGNIIKKLDEENKIKPSKNFVDNKKVGTHGGLYPLLPDGGIQELEKKYNSLSIDEKRIFELVVNRFLGIMNGPYIYESSEIILQNDVHFFKSKGKVLINKGWKEYYKLTDKKNNDIELPNIKKGDIIILENTELKELKTKKPIRYSKAGLGKVIDNLALLVKEDKVLSDRIKKISPKGDRQLGLGTGGTRSNIIDGLEKNNFISIKAKKLTPTNKGFKLISIIKDNFKDPITTGEWEDYLKKIEEGEGNYDEFIKKIKDEISKVIKENNPIVSDKYKYQHILEGTIGICPKCGIGELKPWEKGYSCTALNCKFIIWKMFLGKILKEKEIIKLLDGKILEKEKMFSEKKKKSYEANIYFDFKENKIKISF